MDFCARAVPRDVALALAPVRRGCCARSLYLDRAHCLLPGTGAGGAFVAAPPRGPVCRTLLRALARVRRVHRSRSLRHGREHAGTRGTTTDRAARALARNIRGRPLQ